jgi:hypothetical protein
VGSRSSLLWLYCREEQSYFRTNTDSQAMGLLRNIPFFLKEEKNPTSLMAVMKVMSVADARENVGAGLDSEYHHGSCACTFVPLKSLDCILVFVL